MGGGLEAKQRFIESRAERAKVNPYRARILQYPGRIFCFEEGEAEDEAKIRELVTSGAPILVELGSGSGAHLIGQASKKPDSLCFGFEIRFKRAVRTVEKSGELQNTFVLRADHRNLPKYFAAGSISELYVNFPDPWDKKAQKKHRILSPWLLDQPVLKSGGFLSVKTDHQEYYESFRAQLRSDPRYEVEGESAALGSDEWDNVQTEFERLFRSQNLPIFFIRARYLGE